MSFTISVYQRKRPGELEWHTLGLGALSTMRVGTSPTKLQRAIADDLKKAIRKMKPEDAAALELVRGRRLVRARVDVSFGGRGRASGLFPVVLEPRLVAPGRTATIAYHPLRQDDWVVAEEPALEDALRRFWSWAWRELDPAFVREGLTTDGKDSLRAFSFEEPLPRLIDQLEDEEDPWADLEIDPKRDKKRKRRYGRAQLKAVGANVTLRVADRTERLGRPREPWRGQLAELATGPRKRSIVLVGPPGVGKSTILTRWVADLLEADDFGAHRNLDRVHEVWRVSSRRILAGMSHFGEWEERCLELAHEASDPRVVLWAEDLHTFGRAGRTRDSDRTIADVLRGPLLRGEVTIVGESTEGEWQRLVEDAPGFADLFTVLRVTEADPSETQALLVAEARELEAARRVRFEPSAYRAITSLGEALHPGTARPGVTVDLLRRLADEHAAEASEVASVDASRVIAFLSRRTGLPEVLLSPDGVLSVDELSAQLGQHVLGQPEAIDAAVDLVARIRAGLTDAERPYASYLFTGPTGTGKTQMARAIAGFLYGGEQRLVRVDMGEMSGPDAVARLIGDRFDPRGMLTDAVRQQPFCVVLLDEIEKAHPAVLQLLLQLLDEGRLTDAAGETADFRRSVIVMTSNLGARPRAAVGFGESADAVVRDVDRAVREFFPPELFNRIDRVVSFRPLTPEIAERVAEKELAQLLARRGLTDRRVFVFAEDEAVRRMAREAFDARDGARSVKRYLEDRIGGLLADELAGGSRAQMRIVRIYGGEGDYRLHVDQLVEAEPNDAEHALAGLLDQPASVLRGRLPSVLSRARAMEDGEAYAMLRERIGELVRESGRGDRRAERTLYHLDAFRAELRALREELELRTDGHEDVARELELDEHRPRVAADSWQGERSVRVLHRRGLSRELAPIDRDRLLRLIAETAFLEGALPRLDDPCEHRVFLELMRVGQGRRPPRYERAPEAFFEWLARLYAGMRGEVVSAAARDADGQLTSASEPVDLDALLASRPLHLVLEVMGVGVRTFFAGEEGCHLWSSLLSGSEVVRVRAIEPAEDATPASAIADHLRAARDFQAALARGDWPLPSDPAGLLPAVRRVRFDPPARPGETALLEIEDLVTSEVRAHQVARVADGLRPLVWLRASRIGVD